MLLPNRKEEEPRRKQYLIIIITRKATILSSRDPFSPSPPLHYHENNGTQSAQPLLILVLLL